MEQSISPALGDLLPEQPQVITAETAQEPSQFWLEQTQYIHDYTVFLTICFGIIIGLLCALLIKRG